MDAAFHLQNFIIRYRRPFIIGIQVVLIPISYLFSFALRFDFSIHPYQIGNFLKTVPFLILCRLFFFFYFDLFSGWWRYVSIEDLKKILKAVFFSSICFIVFVVFIFNLQIFPRSVFIIDTITILSLLCGIRILTRLLRERIEPNGINKITKNVLILGAGSAGISVLNEIRSNPDLHINPVGFLDDNPSKQGFKIKDIEVLGTHSDIPMLVPKHNIDEILIAIPSAPYKDLQKIFQMCEKAEVHYKTLPSIADIISGKTFFSQMRDVHPDELLGRPSVSFRRESDRRELKRELYKKCILVTGAGGSIGSELCRQIALFSPKVLILYERNENNLYFIDLELRQRFPQLHIVSFVGDILNREKFENIIKMYSPDIIYHAAAYKHVPLMEKDPTEAIRNNVFGTKTIADLCVAFGVKKFIFISTDKAVNPTSVMGATKRMTEKLLQTYGNTKTKFLSVRFGNVVGSNGSVIPLFKKQIASGGPITITHPEATRFLMTIPEAVQLVLVAGTLGKGGEIFLLDMGSPVNIIDLAKNLIELSGLTPFKDINIEFIGLREGEKLHEELYWEGEDVVPTVNKKIKMLSNSNFKFLIYKIQISKLEKLIAKSPQNDCRIYEIMKEMVPESSLNYFQKYQQAH